MAFRGISKASRESHVFASRAFRGLPGSLRAFQGVVGHSNGFRVIPVDYRGLHKLSGEFQKDSRWVSEAF